MIRIKVFHNLENSLCRLQIIGKKIEGCEGVNTFRSCLPATSVNIAIIGKLHKIYNQPVYNIGVCKP